MREFWLCKLFGHRWDRYRIFNATYHCAVCNQWFGGILPKGKRAKEFKTIK